MLESILETLVILVVFGALVYLANVAQAQSDLRRLFYVIVSSLNGVLVLLGLFTTVVASNNDERYGGVALIITGLIATLPLFTWVQMALVRVFPKHRPHKALSQPNTIQASSQLAWMPFAVLTDDDVTYMPYNLVGDPSSVMRSSSTPDNDGSELLGYNPQSVVHVLALVLMMYVLGGQIALFILGGGREGYAESVEVTLWALLPNFIPFVLLSLLGVGWFSRRSWSQVVARLGLNLPTFEDIVVGIGAGVGLFFLQGILAVIWVLIVGIDSVEEQSEGAQAVVESINTVWLALAVAITAGIGEEIAFRGALQPIFGLWWTALFFTLVHMQYTLSPAALIIFVVALALGYLRRYYGLYAVILTHFVYNAIQLLLNVWMQ